MTRYAGITGRSDQRITQQFQKYDSSHFYSEWCTISRSFSEAEHLAFDRGQDDDIGRVALDDADGEAAEFVMHPDIPAGMQAKVILPKFAREGIADDQHGGPSRPVSIRSPPLSNRVSIGSGDSALNPDDCDHAHGDALDQPGAFCRERR
jgi:hypothetical protein